MISSLKKRSKQESEELNMVAQAERLKISITEENRAIRALQEAAYIKGYMTAELRERERRKKARERRKRKRYFLTQKLYGVAMLILTAVSVKLLEGGHNGGVCHGSNGNSVNYFQGNADCK